MEYLKKRVNAFNLHMIKTSRFKTVLVELLFRKPVVKEEITKNNFLVDCLTFSSKNYKTRKEMIIKQQDLYGAEVGFHCYRLGSYYTSDMYMTCLNEKYTEKGMFKKSLNYFFDVLRNPNIENGKFDLDTFNIVKNNMYLQLDRIKEDGAKHSIVNMFDRMASGEIISYHGFGYREDLEKITPENLVDYYKNFYSDRVLDVFVVGDIDFDEVEEIMREKLDIEVREEYKESVLLTQKIPEEIRGFVDKDGSDQGKLSIGCKIDTLTDFERDYVLNLYNIILGSGVDSKFFKNIREKHSICYYVSSSTSKSDNVLVITSGINPSNLDKMLDLIDKELNDMMEGNFTLEDIEKAKSAYISMMDEVYDYPSQIVSYYLSSDMLNSKLPEERKEEVLKVTKEDIVNLSKKIYVDTIYMLGGK